MTTYLDYFVPEPGAGIMQIMVLNEGDSVRRYGEGNLEECMDELLGPELIVTYQRPYYTFRNSFKELEHVLKLHHTKERWFDLFAEIRKQTGKQISLNNLIKGTFGENLALKVRRLGNSLGDPRYNPGLDGKMEDRLWALKEMYEYVLQFDQVSYIEEGTTYWAEITVNENPELEDW